MSNKRINLAFTLIGDGNWSGGLNYQRTLFSLISGPLEQYINATLFVSAAQKKIASDTFSDVLKDAPILVQEAPQAGKGISALKSCVLGYDPAFSQLMAKHSIDVVFENAKFYGASFPKPIISWIPDFQHKHLPHLFTTRTRVSRDLGFRAQTTGKRIILLSSDAARRDSEKFYPKSINKIRIARFCARPDLKVISERARTIRADYNLPDSFFYLPNHFWRHKNHEVVLRALLALKGDGTLVEACPIIMTGPTTDSRDIGLFERTMESAKALGISPWFRHIGMVPYKDVLALNYASRALINPSLFEGWASSVEEAKSLGTRLIVSNLDVHREQAPEAVFFNADDATSLAVAILNLSRGPGPRRDSNAILDARNSERLNTFANSFHAAVQDAHALGK